MLNLANNLYLSSGRMGEQIGKGGCSPCTVITSKFVSVHCFLFCLFDFSE